MSDGNVLSDLMKDLRGAWGSRISNPLTGAFAISWVAVNFRLIVVLLSSSPFVEKFRFIDAALYPTTADFLLKCIALPLALAIFYIYAIPVPTEKVYRWTLDRQRRLNTIAREVAGERLLSADEARAFIQQADLERNSLTSQIKQVEDNAEKLRQDVIRAERNLQEQSEQASRALAAAQEEHATNMAESSRRAAEMSWALTYEQAISLEYAPPEHSVGRMNRFLTAKEFDVVKNSQQVGRVRFRASGAVTHSASGEFKGWKHWKLTADHRLLIMDDDDRQTTEYEWQPRLGKWVGSINGYVSTLSV